jgi:hypothetical protein
MSKKTEEPGLDDQDSPYSTLSPQVLNDKELIENAT